MEQSHFDMENTEKFLKNIIGIKDQTTRDSILKNISCVGDIFFNFRKELRKLLNKQQNEKIDAFEHVIIESQKVMFLKEENVYNKYFFNYLLFKYYNIDYEYITLILFKNKKYFCEKVLSVGTLNQSFFYGRELFKHIFESEADGYMIIHNHPSGDHTPSKADVDFTDILFSESKKLNINFFDSLIVTKTNIYSIIHRKSVG